jgi:prevent-host-death family protein
MRTVQASEAKAQFLRLLDDVERGETISITRHGKQIAILSPRRELDHERARRAFENILEIRKRTLPVSLEEILSARDEGRR